LAQKSQFCEQQGFWGLISLTGFRSTVQWFCCWLKLRRIESMSRRSSWADLPYRLQEAQFCGVASGETELAGLDLLLPMEQWEPGILLAQECQFPWNFRVKVAGPVLGGVWSSEFLYVLGSRTYCQGSTK
jgi:hypothetical protein